jgi:hypothetical protein
MKLDYLVKEAITYKLGKLMKSCVPIGEKFSSCQVQSLESQIQYKIIEKFEEEGWNDCWRLGLRNNIDLYGRQVNIDLEITSKYRIKTETIFANLKIS